MWEGITGAGFSFVMQIQLVHDRWADRWTDGWLKRRTTGGQIDG